MQRWALAVLPMLATSRFDPSGLALPHAYITGRASLSLATWTEKCLADSVEKISHGLRIRKARAPD